MLPSAEDARHGPSRIGAPVLLDVQKTPEFVDVKTAPPLLLATANLVPSADDATLNGWFIETLLLVQVVPESEDT